MGLKCGIVGLPNVGKSTLFNALTAAKALAANYPFATKEPNIGVIQVPDPRLYALGDIVKPESVIPTTVEIVDIAGLIKGASKGDGLGNQFLGNIREVDAIIHIIRCFEDDNVLHVDGSVDPVRDKEVVDLELLFKDIETMGNRIEKISKNAKSGTKESKLRVEAAQNILKQLENGVPARNLKTGPIEEQILIDTALLTAKPVLYVYNVDEESIINGNDFTIALDEIIKDEDAGRIIICAGTEADIAEFDDPSVRAEFLNDLGLEEPGLHRLIRACYDLLNLVTFFTMGPKEVKAWTVRKGTLAPQAGGTIHSDFERGFIRAEVIKIDDFLALGSEASVREAGKMHIEGREYTVCDGDVIYFRFHV
jgi:GTP-binding protein YchF